MRWLLAAALLLAALLTVRDVVVDQVNLGE